MLIPWLLFGNIKTFSFKICLWWLGLILCMYIAVYDVSGAASDRNCVVLSDIHIDIMDYIQPATCTDAEFRQMWAEFEWENKVSPWEVSLNSCLCFFLARFSYEINPTKKCQIWKVFQYLFLQISLNWKSCK